MIDYDSTPIQAIKERIRSAAAQSAAGSIESLRQGMKQTGIANPPGPDILFGQRSFAGRTAHQIWAKGASQDHVIYYLHGGGYVAGSASYQISMLGELSRAANATVLALDYSLAPENPFPKSFEEAKQGLRDLRAEHKSIALAGDSAGGGLALSILAEDLSTGPTEVRAAALFSPWIDLSLSSPSLDQFRARDPVVRLEGLRQMVAAFAPATDPRDPRISPLFAEMTGMPPLLLQVGSDEALLDDALALDRAARARGGDVTLEVWPEMIHVWHRFTASLPQAKQALHRAGQFLRKHLQA